MRNRTPKAPEMSHSIVTLILNEISYINHLPLSYGGGISTLEDIEGQSALQYAIDANNDAGVVSGTGSNSNVALSNPNQSKLL